MARRTLQCCRTLFLLCIPAILLSACLPPVQEPAWQMPRKLPEKIAYGYSHALKLPPGVPEPVPFNFPLAYLRAALPWEPSVAQQYFDHLCRTEAGEYIFKRVYDVDGIYQMRPRKTDFKLYFDRYALEEPTGVAWSNDADILDAMPDIYVQPMFGVYEYLERPAPGGGVVRYQRERNFSALSGKMSFGQKFDFENKRYGIPIMYNKVADKKMLSRYGYTWRGIHRLWARGFGIAAGEYLVVDFNSGEVLALKRRFKLSHPRSHDRDVSWETARPCESELEKNGSGRFLGVVDGFVKSVLLAPQDGNERYMNSYMEFKKSLR